MKHIMKHRFIYLMLASLLVLTSCEKDNYDPPTAMLKGQVVYQGEPIGVRSDGVQLELWQHGYDFFTKIPVYVDQDGSFSASLFDGDYKLVLLRGNGPWIDNSDSIDVHVKGTVNVDVPVTPYYIVKNANFTRSGNVVSSTFNVEEITAGRAIDRLSMYVGNTVIVDAIRKEGWADIWGADVGDLSEAKSMTINLEDFGLGGKQYIYVRAGIAIIGVPEMIYTEVVKLEL